MQHRGKYVCLQLLFPDHPTSSTNWGDIIIITENANRVIKIQKGYCLKGSPHHTFRPPCQACLFWKNSSPGNSSSGDTDPRRKVFYLPELCVQWDCRETMHFMADKNSVAHASSSPWCSGSNLSKEKHLPVKGPQRKHAPQLLSLYKLTSWNHSHVKVRNHSVKENQAQLWSGKKRKSLKAICIMRCQVRFHHAVYSSCLLALIFY